jgi:hypothetical protein
MQNYIKEALSIYNFHKDQQEKIGIARAGRPHHGKLNWSIRDTASALDICKTTVHESLIIIEYCIIEALLDQEDEDEIKSRRDILKEAKDARRNSK